MIAAERRRSESGVQAHDSAGTPLHIPAADAATLDTLEFGAALELVAARTAGPLGAERVRARRPSTDPDSVRTALRPVGELLVLLRRREEMVVPPVPRLKEVLGRLRLEGAVLEPSDLLAVRRTLGAARVVAAELHRVREEAPLVAALGVELPPRIVERRLMESVDEENGDLHDSASPQLGAARREVQTARERLVRKLETLLRGLDAQAAPAGAAVTMREGRYVIPVRRDSRSRPDGIVHDESGSAGTLFLEPTAAIPLGNALRSALADEQRATLQVLRDLTDLLRPVRAEVAACHEMCVAMDDLVARARYARDVDAELPEIAAAGEALILHGARHPLLLERLSEVVPFDLKLVDGVRTLLVTGPNTGGKTVMLKTVGLAGLLAQSGIVPPVGAGSVLPVFRQVFADIGDHQSIAADLSTFSAHVALLRQVLERADRGTLVLLDEVGSGTDPAEGAALAGASLRSLTARGVLTLATTHLGALKILASQVPGVVNGSLHFDTSTLAPTYRFQAGVPGRSYGLAIARRLGVDPTVLAEAESAVPHAERDLEALLAAAEERVRELGTRLEALAEAEAEASELRDRLAAREGAVVRREEDLKGRERSAERYAREGARNALLGARARVEAAVRVAAGASEEAAREARRMVEEGIQLEGEAVAALADVPSLGPSGPVVVGGRVRTAAGAVGSVLSIRGDGRLVVAAGAMRLVVPPEQVMALPPARGNAKTRPAAAPALERSAPSAPMEIDLRGLRVDEAESVTVAAIDAATLAENPHLRIIHGMGTGAVRDRVQQVLRSDRRVAQFAFAPSSQGGTGVTIVEFGT